MGTNRKSSQVRLAVGNCTNVTKIFGNTILNDAMLSPERTIMLLEENAANNNNYHSLNVQTDFCQEY